MAEVALRKVVKRFDDVEAVRSINLDIADHEFVVLVGPSGCGKSTTLRMIAGLEEITAGDIYIGGDVVNDVPPKDRDIAMVFQNYALYPHMIGVREHGVRAEAAQIPQGRDQAARRRGRAHPRHHRAARPQAEGACPAASASASRWAAPSCATRKCSCSTSRCRTSTPSCACRCAPRSRSVHQTGQDHHGLRHPRPGRGDDAGRPRRGDERRRDRADRHAAGALSPSRDALRRRLHRLAGDEFPALPAGAERRRAARAHFRRDQPAGAGRAIGALSAARPARN